MCVKVRFFVGDSTVRHVCKSTKSVGDSTITLLVGDSTYFVGDSTILDDAWVIVR
jgi:hypothetical protein